MSRRLVSLIGAALVAAVVSFPALAGQVRKPPPKTGAWTVPHTPWGDPDLQGVWNDATSTPLARPDGASDKQVLTDEEAAEFQRELAYNLTRDRRDGGPEAERMGWLFSRTCKIGSLRPLENRPSVCISISSEKSKTSDGMSKRRGLSVYRNYPKTI